jgi:hypothetical protein
MINKKDRLLIDTAYFAILPLSEGSAWVKTDSLKPSSKEEGSQQNEDGSVLIEEIGIENIEGGWKFTGDKNIEHTYRFPVMFNEGYAAALLDTGRFVILREDGSQILKEDFDTLYYDEVDKTYRGHLGNRLFVYSPAGDFHFSVTDVKVSSFFGDYAFAKKDEKFAIINWNGELRSEWFDDIADVPWNLADSLRFRGAHIDYVDGSSMATQDDEDARPSQLEDEMLGAVIRNRVIAEYAMQFTDENRGVSEMYGNVHNGPYYIPEKKEYRPYGCTDGYDDSFRMVEISDTSFTLKLEREEYVSCYGIAGYGKTIYTHKNFRIHEGRSHLITLDSLLNMNPGCRSFLANHLTGLPHEQLAGDEPYFETEEAEELFGNFLIDVNGLIFFRPLGEETFEEVLLSWEMLTPYRRKMK